MNTNEALEEQWRVAHSEHCTNMQNCSSFGGDKPCHHPRPVVEGYSVFSHAQSGHVVVCPKCKQTSGGSWSQCKGECPMPASPHHTPLPALEDAALDAPIAPKRVRSPRGWAVEAGLGLGPQFTQTCTVPKPRVTIDTATVNRMAKLIENLARERDLLDDEIKTWMINRGADPKDGWCLVLPATRDYDLGNLSRLKYVVFTRTTVKPYLAKRNGRG